MGLVRYAKLINPSPINPTHLIHLSSDNQTIIQIIYIMVQKLFQPFGKISKQTFIIMMVFQVVVALLLWHTASNGLIPKPGKVAEAFLQLMGTRLLIDNIL